MIEFEHKLPAMKVDGIHLNGTYNNRELGFLSILTTLDPRLGLFYMPCAAISTRTGRWYSSTGESS